MIADTTVERGSWFHSIGPERVPEFLRKGYRQRHVFPHRIYYLPKCGPDGFKLAHWMCGEADVNRLWEVVLYATEPLIGQFPRDLFFDDELVWHQQQFGRPGQIATANLVLRGKSLYSMVHISDLVQRISRRREHKTRVENRFRGWNQMLLNGILHFAARHGAEAVFVPTCDWALQNTDPSRHPGRELFHRIYDRDPNRLFRAELSGRWWRLDVRQNAERVVAPEPVAERLPSRRTICLCHDIEGGHGHRDSDAVFARQAERMSRRNLEDMLRAERRAGIRATYSVVGLLLQDVRESVEAGGHCIAFHSYDHRIADDEAPAATPAGGEDQLARCRQLDYRIKGYRPPQSKITPELSDANLCWHNFEWLGSSAYSFGFSEPIMQNRLVKIPIEFDDFFMYHRRWTYEEWELEALSLLQAGDFVAFCLHDCYGQLWLPRYEELLDKIRGLGEIKTLDEVASDVTFGHADSLTNGAAGAAPLGMAAVMDGVPHGGPRSGTERPVASRAPVSRRETPGRRRR